MAEYIYVTLPSERRPMRTATNEADAAGGGVPPSNPLTGPTAPRRPACAAGSLASHSTAGHPARRGDFHDYPIPGPHAVRPPRPPAEQ